MVLDTSENSTILLGILEANLEAGVEGFRKTTLRINDFLRLIQI